MAGSAMVSVHIVEPLAISRAAMAALIDGEPGLRVVGASEFPDGSLTKLGPGKPIVLLARPDLPDLSPAWLRQTLATCPLLKIVLLADSEHFSLAADLLHAGAAGCFLTSDSPDSLFDGLRAAGLGETALSSAVARRLLSLRDPGQPAHPSTLLTAREREILALLTDGLTNKQIAQRLYLSARTVEAHLRSIYGKLGVQSRLEAVVLARRTEFPVPL